MKKILVLLMTLSISLFVYSAQAKGKGIREKIADSYYAKLAYEKAIPYYVDLAKRKGATAEVLRKTADCFTKVGNTEKATYWYGQLYDRGDANLEDKYNYLLSLRKSGDYEKSLVILEDYLNMGGDAEFAQFLKENPNYVDELKSVENQERYLVTELPFNSEQHDFCPNYFENGIIFASPSKKRRGLVDRKFAWDMSRFLQLYYVQVDENGNYSEPELYKFSKKDKYHDGPVTFNRDFTEAYLTRSSYTGKGKLRKGENGIVQVNLFVTYRNQENGWTELQPFKYSSPEYSTGCATLSKEGDVMVFASDMPGGEGMSDLWMCRKDENGEWGEPVHLGDNINTERRDNYPFLDDEGNLYYASDGGLKGLGGYDVYWVPGFLRGKTKVLNIGAPINSNADDFGFIYNSNNSKGYFNSGREGVKGTNGCDDIFSFERLLSFIDVQILDKDTEEPIVGALGCLKTEMGESLKADIATDDQASFYEEVKPSKYLVCANAEGYEGQEIAIETVQGKVLAQKIYLTKLPEEPVVEKVECPEITIEDIYYDFDKYAIREDATASLDELREFLMDNPNVSVKLMAHTDCRGTAEYNLQLSQKRAESALNYLAERGIAVERMTAIGFGESEPVNGCVDGVKCTDTEYQANRRTVIELISDGCIQVNHTANPYNQ